MPRAVIGIDRRRVDGLALMLANQSEHLLGNVTMNSGAVSISARRSRTGINCETSAMAGMPKSQCITPVRTGS
jgi:hypothetical protein